MLIIKFITLTLIWSINGQEQEKEEKKKLNASYAYLPMPNKISLSDQYPQRAGFGRGKVGTKTLPVIFPPHTNVEPHQLISLYRPSNSSSYEAYCKSEKILDFTTITSFFIFFVETKLATRLAHKTAVGLMVDASKQFVTPMSLTRLQFITFYCMVRHHTIVKSSDQDNVIFTSQPYPDLYRFCPSSCADREGAGMDSDQRKLLTRFSQPCSYPQNRLLFTSRRCVESAPVPIVHRETFQCSCQGNAEWQDQLKTCRINLFADNKPQVQTNEADAAKKESIPEHLDCHREGTKYVGGVGLDADSGGDEIISSKHQVLRCVCKPQYYGSRCDQLKDPCTMSIGNALPGNVACNVKYKENKCVPHKAESRYTCKCGDNFRKISWLKSLPPGRLLDNCLRQKDPCAAQSCMHGICVLSDLGSARELRGKLQREPFSWVGREPRIVARCLCNAGWSGERCSFPLALNGWSPWSPWTACEPSCQSSLREMPPHGQNEMVESSQSTPRWGVRQRTRYRDCMGDASDCSEQIRERSANMGLKMVDGQSWRQYERRACRPRPCDRHLYLAMGKRAVKRSKIMKQVRETLKQAYTVHLWTVLAFTFVFAIFGFVAAFATKMHSEKVFETDVPQDPARLRSRQRGTSYSYT